MSPASLALAGGFFATSTTWEAHECGEGDIIQVTTSRHRGGTERREPAIYLQAK